MPESPFEKSDTPTIRHSRESGNPYSYPDSCFRGDEGPVTTARGKPSARGGYANHPSFPRKRESIFVSRFLLPWGRRACDVGSRRIRQGFLRTLESGNPHSYPDSRSRGDTGAVATARGRPSARGGYANHPSFPRKRESIFVSRFLFPWGRRACDVGSRRIRSPFRHSRESGNPHSYPVSRSRGDTGAVATARGRPSARGGCANHPSFPRKRESIFVSRFPLPWGRRACDVGSRRIRSPFRHSRESGNPYSYPVSCSRGDTGAVTTVRGKPSARGGYANHPSFPRERESISDEAFSPETTLDG